MNNNFYIKKFLKQVQFFHKDGNGFIDRKEFCLMLKFSSETFTPDEIEVKILIRSRNDPKY